MVPITSNDSYEAYYLPSWIADRKLPFESATTKYEIDVPNNLFDV